MEQPLQETRIKTHLPRHTGIQTHSQMGLMTRFLRLSSFTHFLAVLETKKLRCGYNEALPCKELLALGAKGASKAGSLRETENWAWLGQCPLYPCSSSELGYLIYKWYPSFLNSRLCASPNMGLFDFRSFGSRDLVLGSPTFSISLTSENNSKTEVSG